MKTKILIPIVTIFLFATGCSDWLDVQPKSEVTTDRLFNTEDGFIEALTGVYVSMGNTSHYGSKASMAELDMLAQYYTTNNQSFDELMNYEYGTAIGQSMINDIWGSAYYEIANLNNLLSQLEQADKSIFNENMHDLIKGEALGSRAFLHFDLYRLYAPHINSGSENTVELPFVTELQASPASGIEAGAFLQKVIDDLEAAEALLEDLDGLSIYGDNESNGFNAYAVKALLARVHANMGNTAEAYSYATEVIDSQAFNWVTLAEVQAGDLLFSNEIIFGIYQQNLDVIQENYFQLANTSQPTLAINVATLDEVFEGLVDDIRRVNLFKPHELLSSEFTLVKYRDFNGLNPVIPLIKLGELYLIAAENAPDNATALDLLNMVRTNRLITELPPETTAEDVATGIKNEYKKEMYGDGQLFFYYKKHGLTPEQGAAPILEFDPSSFVLPLPDNEVEFGN